MSVHFFCNKEIISHAEVLAIKQALVRALSQNGVREDVLNKIRRDLGIASTDSKDRDLRYRSIMPLTRQKIREILDQNADVINKHNAETGGDLRIRSSQQVYGQNGMDATMAAKREDVKADFVANMADNTKDISNIRVLLSCVSDLELNMLAEVQEQYAHDIFDVNTAFFEAGGVEWIPQKRPPHAYQDLLVRQGG